MKFLYGKSVILYKDAYIIGDTHFGIENRLREKGISLNFSEILMKKLIKDIDETTAKKLFIVGDAKDNILRIDSITEKILLELNDRYDLTIVKGNHDGGLEKLKLNLNITHHSGFVYHDLGLAHGHSWPSEDVMKSKYLIMAHQHPLIEHKDSFGKNITEPVFIVLEPNSSNIKKHYTNFNKKLKTIILPSYNPLIGSVFSISSKNLGPLFHNKLFKYNSISLYSVKGFIYSLNPGCFDGKKKKRS